MTLNDTLLSLFEVLIEAMNALGYTGIFVLMALESSIIPVPSEAVLIPAGVLIARGEMSMLLALLTAVAGSMVGSLASYYFALILGRRAFSAFVRRYGRFILLDEQSILRTEQYFVRHGEITIFIARLLPVVRHLISLPAGLGRMPPSTFCLYTALGAALWAIVLLLLGFYVGENIELVHQHLTAITFIVIALSVLIVIIYVWWKKRTSSTPPHLQKKLLYRL